MDGLYAVGHSGQILFRGETGWATMLSGAEQNLIGVHGRSGGRVVIAGAQGALYEVLRGDPSRR